MNVRQLCALLPGVMACSYVVMLGMGALPCGGASLRDVPRFHFASLGAGLGRPALLPEAKLSKKQEKLNAQHADAIAAARIAADAWLKIEDAETYEKSWDAGSDYFHSQVPLQGWVRRMQAMRKSIDPVLTRDLTATEWKTEVNGLPAGEYVAFVYETVFSSGRPQLESVVMVHQTGVWKMVGYAVQ